jgi:oligopeptide transport system substrate-binding protein
MAERNLTLDWYPIGTGPYMLSENNPNARMVLERNPNFRRETYPARVKPGDMEAGLLADCGKRLPLVDKVVFTREKEQIPYWNKFLQGYYDASGISRPTPSTRPCSSAQTGESACRTTCGAGHRAAPPRWRPRPCTWASTARPGGRRRKLGERARKLRQAISIAIDQEEFISIFQNGRGVPAQGRCRRASSATARTPDGINRQHVRLGGRAAEAQADRRGQAPAGRGRLAEWARCDGPANRW